MYAKHYLLNAGTCHDKILYNIMLKFRENHAAYNSVNTISKDEHFGTNLEHFKCKWTDIAIGYLK